MDTVLSRPRCRLENLRCRRAPESNRRCRRAARAANSPRLWAPPGRCARRTGTISTSPIGDATLRASFAVDADRRHRCCRDSRSISGRPIVSQPAMAASIRPGNSSTGRLPLMPNAAVSPGEIAMPCAATWPLPGQRLHACVVAPAAGAADGDDGVGRAYPQARRRDRRRCAAWRNRARSGRAPADRRRHRAPRRDRRAPSPGGCGARAPEPAVLPAIASMARLKSLSRHPARAMKSPARRSAPLGSTPSPAVAGAIASKRPPRLTMASSGTTASMPGGSASPTSTTNRRNRQRRGRIGPGVGDILGANGIAVDQRPRLGGLAGRGRDVLRQRAVERAGQIDHARRHRRRRPYGREHVVERRQPRDALIFRFTGHRPTLYCRRAAPRPEADRLP